MVSFNKDKHLFSCHLHLEKTERRISMSNCGKTFLIIIVAVAALLCAGNAAYANDTCKVADNGSGTIDLPAACPYTAPDEPMFIIEGLPAGTTIELDPTFDDFNCDTPNPLCTMPNPPGVCEGPGGTLGGHGQCFEGTLYLAVSGTGDLNGFVRSFGVPIFCEIHTAPRTPGDSIQNFPAKIYRLFGELFGDPDFCTFRVIAGEDYGLPSPGQYTLTKLDGGNFNVDSFFDITYRIEFEGCPGSPLDGYAGITTATVRWQQGIRLGPPLGACCMPDGSCSELTEEECLLVGTYYGDDTHCLGDNDGDTNDDLCVEPYLCIAPDNGSGTVDFPADCPYESEDDLMYIIEGFPPETTIEMVPVLDEFFCDSETPCSAILPGGVCETTGGSMGGNLHCFEASLDLTASGTGELEGFNRHLVVPVNIEVHTAPRTPGDPLQAFPAEMFRLNGQLFGDPDFCEFIITAGFDYGLPSPGQFTLTRLSNGNFAVESFFDITYRIQFEGCPGSPLDDYAGSTIETIRWRQGASFGYAYLPGDANMHNGAWPPAVLGADVTYLINYFRAMETSQSCLLDGFWCSADVNGDCMVIGSDVTKLVGYLRGSPAHLNPCQDYPPLYPPIPPSPPPGWPNCE
jgi:hypothetical protein